MEARLSRLTLPTLHTFMDILDISRGSDTKVRDSTHRFFHLPRPATWTSNCGKFVADDCRSKQTNEPAQITLWGGRATACVKISQQFLCWKLNHLSPYDLPAGEEGRAHLEIP